MDTEKHQNNKIMAVAMLKLGDYGSFNYLPFEFLNFIIFLQ